MRKTKLLPALFLTLAFSVFTFAQNYQDQETADFENSFSRAANSPSLAGLDLPTPQPEKIPPSPARNTMSIGSKFGYIFIAYHAVCAYLTEAGVLPDEGGTPGFELISERVLETVKNSRYHSRSAGQNSLLEDPGFIAEMEAITGAKFSKSGTAEPLINGPASFAVKDRLMKEAKKSIYVVSYAFYDDVTGNESTNILVAKKKEGLDIKVVVDDKMAHVFGAKLLKKMADAGIGVARYVNPDRTHNFLHVKMLIVDGENAVIGGMNYGDAYSHKGDGPKWRDTDILYTGPAVAESLKKFADIWNISSKPPQTKLGSLPGGASTGGQARIAVLHQEPPRLDPPILLSVIKAIYGATRQINIENAYIVAIPAITQAIADAKARGVEVNVLTNSKESIDSDGKSMAEAILASVKLFADAGANVYIKQGQTLHSKFMTVDGVFTNIGSYNFHPRSERYDMELNINVLDRDTAAKLDAAFAKDISEAKKTTSKDLEKQNPGWLGKIMQKYFYSQLSQGIGK